MGGNFPAMSERSSEIVFYTYFLYGYYFFFDTGLCQSAFCTYSFGKLVFRLSVFSAFSVCYVF